MSVENLQNMLYYNDIVRFKLSSIRYHYFEYFQRVGGGGGGGGGAEGCLGNLVSGGSMTCCVYAENTVDISATVKTNNV